MTKKRFPLIVGLALTMTTSMGALALTGCGEEPKPPVISIMETVTGEYYVEVEGQMNTISLSGTSFTMNFLGETKKGTYLAFENMVITMGFDDNSKDKMTATYLDGVLTLTYNGTTYTMVRNQTYTVSFNVGEGATSLPAQQILNGKTARKPETDPTMTNGIFLGWFADEAKTKPFDFTKPITQNTTVYAKFETLDAEMPVYTISFDLGYEGAAPIDAAKTFNKKLFALPTPTREGYEFLGWWMSDYYSAEKLSRKYAQQEFIEDATLYAVWASETPAVSLNADGGSWSAKGTNNNYTVVIKNANGEVLKSQTGAFTSMSFDFSAQPEGDYTMEVTVNGKTGIAYYKNNPLPRVTRFNLDGNVFSFEGVPGAENYTLTVKCGTEQHTHELTIAADGEKKFDFSNCDMKQGGIEFVVKANAAGKASSTSETYIVERNLEALTGLTVDEKTETIKWNAIDGANYVLEFTYNGGEPQKQTLSETSYSIKTFSAGEFKIKVTPVKFGYNSPAAAEYTYNKERLASPANLRVEGDKIKWDAVAGANGYALDIASKDSIITHKYSKDQLEVEITERLLDGSAEEYQLTITALGEDSSENSFASDVYTLRYGGAMGNVAYAKGMLTWDAVFGAKKYTVQLNDGEEQEVANAATSYALTFSSAGEHTITVATYNASGEKTDSKAITVTAYALTFTAGETVETQYKAEGDAIALPDPPNRTGYTFTGWFDAEENGKKLDETNLTLSPNSLAYYAYFTANKYTVNLVVGSLGTLTGNTTYEVTFDEAFELPKPTCKDPMQTFSGWFTQSTYGIQYTDDGGFSLENWQGTADLTLYAQWGPAGVEYKLSPDKTEYYVMQGKVVGAGSNLTIPARHEGKPVTRIIAGAFRNCTDLQIIRIPNTIQVIDVGDNGGNFSGSAFQGCTSLRTVEVYDVDGNRSAKYASVDGMIVSLENGVVNELVFVPYAMNKAGTFTIPDGVRVLPANVMRSMNQVTKVVVPASVVEIQTGAFASCSVLEDVEFLDPEDGSKGSDLFVYNCFNFCYKLQSITFPKRLAHLDYEAFDYCSEFKNIYVREFGDEKDTDNFYDIDGILIWHFTVEFCPKYHVFEGAYTIPQGIQTIGANAFSGCKELEELIIPVYVSAIYESAFEGCTGLTNVNFVSDEKAWGLEILDSAFYGCTLLKSVTLPAQLTKLGEYAFGGISGLATVTLNCSREEVEFANNAFTSTRGVNSVTVLNIGEKVAVFDVNGVFGSDLVAVNVAQGNPYYASIEGVLFDKDITEIVYFPNSKSGDYTIPNTVTKIGARVFYGKAGLKNLTISAKVTEIGEDAFRACAALETLTIEGGDVPIVIGDYAFADCSLLKTINLGARKTTTDKDGNVIGSTIGEGAFAQTKSFVTDSKLTELTIPEGYTSIGKFAFDLAALTAIHLPASLQSVGVFEAGDQLYAVITGTKVNVAIAGVCAFRSCNKLETITVAEGSNYFYAKDGILYGKEKKGDNYVVTSLMFVPWKNQTTALQIPNSVEKVLDYAFYNNQLITEITFEPYADGATPHEFAVGNSAFQSCAALTTMQLPAGTTTLGAGMFSGCKNLKGLIIPNTVTEIAQGAFSGCNSLTTLTFEEGGDKELIIQDGGETGTGDHGSTIYGGVFSGCIALEEVALPSRVKTIGTYAFYGLANLRKVTIPMSVELIKEKAFSGCESLADVVFKDSGNANAKELTIGNMAFYQAGVVNINLPDNLKTIEKNAFYQNQIVTLTIPYSVTTIGDSAFYNANALTTLTFATKANDKGVQANNLESIGTSAFGNAKLLKTLGLETCTSLTTIGSSSFANCSELEAVSLPACIKSVGASTFSGCAKLNNVTFLTQDTEVEVQKTDAEGKPMVDGDGNPVMETVTKNLSHLEKIENTAFAMTALKTFTFPETVKDITLGNYLFNSCKQLSTVNLSTTVTALGASLGKAPAIKQITIPEGCNNFQFDTQQPLILSITVDQASALTTIVSAFGALNTVDGVYTIPEGVVAINDSAFYGQNGIKEIVLPKTMQSIGNNAFKNCRGLKAITITGLADKTCSLAHIGEYAFNCCYSLDNVTLPDTVTSIGKYAFYGCASLKTITMPSVLSSAGIRMFEQCANLTTVNNFPKITSTKKDETGDYAFYNCPNLKTVTFAKDASIPDHMFYECKGLEEIDLSGAKLDKATNAFYNCISLKRVTLDTTKTLPEKMFYGCAALDTITKKGGTPEEGFADLTMVTGLGKNVFTNCGLKKVDASSLTAVADYAFSGCKQLTEVKIGKTTGKYMFQNCELLGKVTFGTGITSLGNYMFSGCTALETIDLPNSITFLGTYTFQKSGLKSVKIPTGVTVLGTSQTACTASASVYLFQGCANLETVTLHKGLTKIGAYVFDGCAALTTVNYMDGDTKVGEDGKFTLPAPLTMLGNYTFRGCAALTAIDISNVTTLGTYEFSGCTLLNSVTLGSKLTSLGAGTFQNCAALTTIDISHITSVGSDLFNGCTSLNSVTFNNTLNALSKNMFKGCTSLKKVTLPESLTVMGTYTFQNSGIEEITIPSGVTRLGATSATGSVTKSTSSYVFDGCESLRKVTMSSSLALIGADTFRNCTALEEISDTSGITLIGNEAFSGCAKLAQLDFSNVTTVGQKAFLNCTAIKEAIMLQLAVLDANAFDGCTALAEVDLGALETVGNYAFRGTGLKSVDLSLVTSLGDYAFTNCENLMTVQLNPSLTKIPKQAFCGCDSLVNITLPAALTEISDEAFLNCSALTAMEIPGVLTTIGGNVFAGCAKLTNLTVNKDNAAYEMLEGRLVEKETNAIVWQPTSKLDSEAEGGVTNITEIVIASGTTIKPYAFNGLGHVTSVTLPNDMTSIPAYAFWGFKGSFGESFTLPASVTTIEARAFQGSNITSIVIPEGVTEIADYAFYNCQNLTTVTLPSTLKKIGASAFRSCPKLATINLPTPTTEPVAPVAEGEEVEYLAIGNYAFEGDTSLTEVVIPAGVGSIGTYCFQGCEALTKVTIGSTVTSIGNYAFYKCPNLAMVTLSEGLETIGSWTFCGSAIEAITIPSTVKTINVNAFAICEKLASVTFTPTADGAEAVPLTIVAGSYSSSETSTSYLYWDATLEKKFNGAFVGDKLLTSIEYPARTATIGAYSLVGTGVTDLKIAAGTKAIGANAFKYMTFTSITLPEGLETIGNSAFEGVPLTAIEIPASVMSIGSSAFKDCAELATLTLNEGLETIDTYAFQNCAKMASVALPTTLTKLGKYAFSHTGLTSITIPGSLEVVGESAFEECHALKSAIVQEGVVELDSYCFRNSENLETVSLPESLTEISYSFRGCTGIKELVIPAGVLKVFATSFEGWTSEQKIIIKAHAFDMQSEWLYNAFYGCAAQIEVQIVEEATEEATTPTPPAETNAQ